MEDLELLAEFGLSKSEAKIYLTILRNEPLNSGRIVKLSKQHVSVVYYSLQRLVEKGFVTHTKKGRFEEYFVTDPEIFLDKLKEMTKDMEQKIPSWKRQAELAKNKISVEVFESMKGIINLYNQIFKTVKKGDEHRIFSVGEEYEDPEKVSFLTKLNLVARKIGIKEKMICNKIHRDIFYRIENQHYLKTVESLNLRFVTFDFPQGVSIFENNVIFLSLTDDVKAVRIRDSKLASQYAKFFDKLYEKGEPYKKR